MSRPVDNSMPENHGGSTMLRSLARAIAAIALAAGMILAGQAGWIHIKAFAAQILLERAFTQTVSSGAATKPWSWADIWPVARIEVPRLGEAAIVLNGDSGQALAFGPGHVGNTPQAGEQGTAVYAAHRDTHFAFLRDVKQGDMIRMTDRNGKTFEYHVTGMTVARWDQAAIDPHAAGRHLVLATCYPFDAAGSGPLRYLVEAEMSN